MKKVQHKLPYKDGDLYYWCQVSEGFDDRTNIVMCHGFDSSSATFDPLRKHLEEFNIYAIDYPCHGHSTASIDKANITEFKNSVEKLIEDLNLKNVVLLGHSLGGGVVSYLHEMEAVKKIVLLSPVNPSIADKEGMLRDILIPKTPEMVMDTWNHLFSDWNNVNRNLFTKEIAEATFRAIEKRREFSTAVAHDVINNKRQWEIAYNYMGFTKPCLVVFGDNDKIIPADESIKWFKRMIKHAHISVIENCGHVPHYEKTDETIIRLKNFLSNLQEFKDLV